MNCVPLRSYRNEQPMLRNIFMIATYSCVAALMGVFGCTPHAGTGGSSPTTRVSRELSVQDARTALIALVVSLPEDHFAKSTLNHLKVSVPENIDDFVFLGSWRLKLPSRKFYLNVSPSPLFESHLEGEFVQVGGTWKAVVTSTGGGHFIP